MKEGKPKRRDAWKPRYRVDLEKAAAPGGEKKKRGKGKMKAGHLAPLLAMPLTAFGPEVRRDTIDDWCVLLRDVSVRSFGPIIIYDGVTLLSLAPSRRPRSLGFCAVRSLAHV
jgi:hypothetical protein